MRNAYTNANGDGNGDPDGNCNSNAYGYSELHTQADSYAKTSPNPRTSPMTLRRGPSTTL